MSRRYFQKDSSTLKTIALLRASDKVMDGICPPSIWAWVKRELIYVAALVWQVPATLTLYVLALMLLYAVVF